MYIEAQPHEFTFSSSHMDRLPAAWQDLATLNTPERAINNLAQVGMSAVGSGLLARGGLRNLDSIETETWPTFKTQLGSEIVTRSIPPLEHMQIQRGLSLVRLAHALSQKEADFTVDRGVRYARLATASGELLVQADIRGAADAQHTTSAVALTNKENNRTSHLTILANRVDAKYTLLMSEHWYNVLGFPRDILTPTDAEIDHSWTNLIQNSSPIAA